MDKIILVDIDKCMGCHTCKLSCALEHSKSSNLSEAIFEKNRTVPRIFIEKINDKCVPIQCMHCDNAPCIAVCPSHAVSRKNDKSPVTINNDRCIGCHECIIICPFGVIKNGPDGKSLIKCDLCIKRLEDGKDPACVESCPTKAIKYLSIKEVNTEKRRRYKVMILQNEQ
ncbi:MAG TPA: 4Fe-4S dicluster domain-containing protein [Victivallales bacterium]|nr:4Fe-4S dicluster domain-containing protein [Victivallales bacterium]